MNQLTLVALAALAAAGPARAVTISELVDPWSGAAYHLDVHDFERKSNRCGSGLSVINDGCSVAIKTDADPVPDGRHALTPGDPWIDSSDIARVRWTVEPINGTLGFLLTDAFDQGANHYRPNGSHFTMTVRSGGETAVWEMAAREPNGNSHFLLLEGLGDKAKVTFDTGFRDGWGVSDAVTAVPVPPAAWMLVAGIAGLLGVGRRRRASAAHSST